MQKNTTSFLKSLRTGLTGAWHKKLIALGKKTVNQKVYYNPQIPSTSVPYLPRTAQRARDKKQKLRPVVREISQWPLELLLPQDVSESLQRLAVVHKETSVHTCHHHSTRVLSKQTATRPGITDILDRRAPQNSLCVLLDEVERHPFDPSCKESAEIYIPVLQKRVGRRTPEARGSSHASRRMGAHDAKDVVRVLHQQDKKSAGQPSHAVVSVHHQLGDPAYVLAAAGPPTGKSMPSEVSIDADAGIGTVCAFRKTLIPEPLCVESHTFSCFTS